MVFLNYFVCCRYPYNNALHHHVESIVYSCLDSKVVAIRDHLLLECHLVEKILLTEKSPMLSSDLSLVFFK